MNEKEMQDFIDSLPDTTDAIWHDFSALPDTDDAFWKEFSAAP